MKRAVSTRVSSFHGEPFMLQSGRPSEARCVVWNAILTPLLGVAIGTRLMDLDREATHHTLGIAEFHGPRRPMMHCLDHPTMLKNGSAWGTFNGVSAALLAPVPRPCWSRTRLNLLCSADISAFYRRWRENS